MKFLLLFFILNSVNANDPKINFEGLKPVINEKKKEEIIDIVENAKRQQFLEEQRQRRQETERRLREINRRRLRDSR